MNSLNPSVFTQLICAKTNSLFGEKAEKCTSFSGWLDELASHPRFWLEAYQLPRKTGIKTFCSQKSLTEKQFLSILSIQFALLELIRFT
jgi:hypothetical protein